MLKNPANYSVIVQRPSDWTERHRPRNEHMLEGNEVQRRKIRAWLDEWQHGIPQKKALLLIGPPGVGKTSVARAIAEDMGWNVVELNASDDRNAAAIRKAATSGAIHRSLFHDPSATNARTLVLLDEVDHLSGGLREVSQSRIEKALLETDENASTGLSGDSGGKAEVLKLLEQTRQPVILACNDEMGLWGSNSSWRSTRDRFTKHVLRIDFSRANDEAIRRIARRVLRDEGIEFEETAIEELARQNHGDLRALIRDLQVMTADLFEKPLTISTVKAYMLAGQRDISVEIFPGLELLYKERTCGGVAARIWSIDKEPNELLEWVHWNNANLFTHAPSVRRASKTVIQADRNWMGTYLSKAHRSSYWTSHLSALSASVANRETLQGKLYPSYPHFLRRSGSLGRYSIVEKLAEFCSSNSVSTREDLLKPLLTLSQADSQLGDPENFSCSLLFGLTAEEHLSLTGLAASRRSSKEMLARYKIAAEEAVDTHELEVKPNQSSSVESENECDDFDEEDDSLPTGQMTLF